ncbi:MAG: hypothetical protein J5917_01770 [Bacteroidales bacterium]|nr:hypothetical protein [Bacteroidales bacterium]
MAEKNKDIRDDEFRVIGHATIPNTSASEKSWRKMGVAIVSAILVIAIGILTIVNWPKDVPEDPNEGLFENAPEQVEHKPVSLLGTTTDAHYTEKLDTVINDVHLSIYIPHNAKPELTLGVPDRKDKNIILAAQAADIRKDNRKILGAFVLKGEPLAWGLSKKGFCAIIEDKVTVGVSENSPLFEEATEKEGYFFRQFPLVDNGTLVESDQKNKTMRKALCSRAGQLFMAVSETDESMHDFAQALVDLDVENAIYLVGSHSSFGWYINENEEKTIFAPDVHRGTYKNENYIIWK